MDMPMSPNSRKAPKKKLSVKKQWKAVPSKRSATTAKTNKTSTKVASKSAPPNETLKLLKRYYPDAHCALNFTNPYELLVATTLSAQCTDERVNLVTPKLFALFPSPEKMAAAPIEKIEAIIHSTGFYRAKAKNIKSAAISIVEKHGGKVPQDMESLVDLAGVGRKTANVVLGNAFNITSGIVVDTHVTRLAQRFFWTRSENAVVIERELEEIIPKEDWILLSHLLIAHGRGVCKARKPQCENCFLFEQCPRIGVN
jgi:endonuclease III